MQTFYSTQYKIISKLVFIKFSKFQWLSGCMHQRALLMLCLTLKRYHWLRWGYWSCGMRWRETCALDIRKHGTWKMPPMLIYQRWHDTTGTWHTVAQEHWCYFQLQGWSQFLPGNQKSIWKWNYMIIRKWGN